MVRHRGAPSRNGRSERLCEPTACGKRACAAACMRPRAYLISYDTPFGAISKNPLVRIIFEDYDDWIGLVYDATQAGLTRILGQSGKDTLHSSKWI